MINAWTETFDWHGNREQREVMRQIFEETEEDLQELVKIFKQASVQVARPKNIFTINGEEQVKLPWMECGYPNLFNAT